MAACEWTRAQSAPVRFTSPEMRSISGEAPHGAAAVRAGSYRAAHRRGGDSDMANRDAYELLLIEEADAWFEYLEATRGQLEIRYKEVEPWAWARLSQRLRAIRTKKQKLKPAAAA
jgi:hypothetical protein